MTALPTTAPAATSLYRNRNYLAYLSGTVVSSFGSSLVDSIWPVIAYWLTASPLITAFTVVAQVGPQILFGLIAGVKVDRTKSLKRYLIIPNVVSALAFIGATAVGAKTVFALLIALAFYSISESATVFYSVAILKVMPGLVDKTQIASARSQMSVIVQLLGFLAPATAIFILNHLGERPLFLINSLSFWVAIGFLALIKLNRSTPISEASAPVDDKPAEAESSGSVDSVGSAEAKTADEANSEPSLSTSIKEGFVYLWNHSQVRIITGVGMINAFLGGTLATLYLRIIDVEFGIKNGDYRVTYCLYAMAIGGLLGSACLPWLRKKLSPIELAISGFVAVVIAMVLISFGGSLPLFLLALLLWDWAYSTIIMNGIVLRMEVVEDEYLGRVSATGRLLSWGTEPIGALLAGFVATHLLDAKTIITGSLVLPLISIGLLVRFNRKQKAAAS